MHEFQRDIDAINDIQSVPTILDVVRQSTGMRFVAIARVTEGRWIACQTLDDIDFGLTAGENSMSKQRSATRSINLGCRSQSTRWGQMSAGEHITRR